MKKITAFCFAVIMLFSLSACDRSGNTSSPQSVVTSGNQLETSSPAEPEASTRVITDMLGREVEIPTEIDSIVCTGAGALRMICYAQAYDLLTGVEDSDKTLTIKRPYNYVYYDYFKDLPSIGKGGGRGYTAYDEEIISLQPDVIFSAYTSDALEELANKTGIPVIYVAYQNNTFDEDLKEALTLIGDMLDKQERCADLITYIDAAMADLNERTQDIPDADKPTAYTGAVTSSGGHGFGGTFGDFPPFTFINASNVADETGKKSAFDVDWEKVLIWDPDYIFLDPGNMSLVNEEYAKNPYYFNSLRAVQEGRVYSMISYNNYTTNIEIALADAYYAGTVLFPEQFADIDIETKTDELLEKFLGKAFYSDMKEAGLIFGEITIGE